MTEAQQAKFEGWAVVEVMGHQRYAGYVTTEAYGQAVLFRIDVPEIPEREHELKSGRYSPDGKYLRPGTKVTEGSVQAYTKLIGSGSIYAITPCTQEAAIRAVEAMTERPLLKVDVPKLAAAANGGGHVSELPNDEYADGDDGDDSDEDDEEDVRF